MNAPLSDPAAIEADIASRATLHRTPLPGGHMVWRHWDRGIGGTPVVFLHGGYGSWAHWIRNVEVIGKAHDVWAGDLPGLGESDAPPKPHTVEGLAGIIADGLAALPGLQRPVHIVAFSFGAMLCGHVAATRPELVASLTVVGTAGLGLPRGQTRLVRKAEKTMTPAEIAALQRENLASLMFADRAKIDDLAVHLQIKNVGRAKVASPPLSLGDSLARNLPAIKAPMAFLWGELDATCLPYMDQRLTFLAEHKPDAHVYLFPRAGHWVQYEDAPAFNAYLLELIRRLEAQR
jgi:2-hydroxy-6-oxonona-2,4-dienedioate hydrolase